MKSFKEIVNESREQHREEAKKYLSKAGDHDEGTFEHHDYMAKYHAHQSKVAIRSDEHMEKAKAHRAKAHVRQRHPRK